MKLATKLCNGALEYSGGLKTFPNDYEWVQINETSMQKHYSSGFRVSGQRQGIKLAKSVQKLYENSPKIVLSSS